MVVQVKNRLEKWWKGKEVKQFYAPLFCKRSSSRPQNNTDLFYWCKWIACLKSNDRRCSETQCWKASNGVELWMKTESPTLSLLFPWNGNAPYCSPTRINFSYITSKIHWCGKMSQRSLLPVKKRAHYLFHLRSTTSPYFPGLIRVTWLSQVIKWTMKYCADVLSWSFRMAELCTTIFVLVLSVIPFVCITSHPARENRVRLKVRQAQVCKIRYSLHFIWTQQTPTLIWTEPYRRTWGPFRKTTSRCACFCSLIRLTRLKWCFLIMLWKWDMFLGYMMNTTVTHASQSWQFFWVVAFG